MNLKDMAELTAGDVTKEEVCFSVEDAMIQVGVAKRMWLTELNLPEAEFDALLAEATDKAEHVAKGDLQGRKIVLSKMLEDLQNILRQEDTEVYEGDEDAEDYNRNNKTRIS